jgi:hypothetical protein
MRSLKLSPHPSRVPLPAVPTAISVTSQVHQGRRQESRSALPVNPADLLSSPLVAGMSLLAAYISVRAQPPGRGRLSSVGSQNGFLCHWSNEGCAVLRSIGERASTLSRLPPPLPIHPGPRSRGGLASNEGPDRIRRWPSELQRRKRKTRWREVMRDRTVARPH